MNINFDKKLFNPNFQWALKVLNDRTIRYAYFYGGSSSSKTYSLVQSIVLMTLTDAKNSLIFRKVQSHIKKTIYNTFVKVIDQLQLKPYFNVLDFKIRCVNGAIIDFSGLEDAEKIKGIESYVRIMVDELSELDIVDFNQLRKRMRGIENQKLLMTFNPIDENHWIKEEIINNFDLKSIEPELPGVANSRVTEVQHFNNSIFVRSTYLDNYYIVGSPCGTYGFVDEHTINDFEQDRILDLNFYNVYALGLWGKLVNGSEFYKQFNRLKHVKKIIIDDELPLHISIDENVRPYLPLVVIQTKDNNINVIDEILGKSPNNNIIDLIKIFSNKYERFKEQKLFIYGDATSRRNDARTEDGYNLFGIMVAELEKNGWKDVSVRVKPSNPSVAQSGRFVNTLLAGMTKYTFNVNEDCISTINDFLYTKEDKDGNIMKEKVKDKINGTTYEKFGHLSDACRYFIIKYLEEEYDNQTGRKSEFIEFNITFDDDIMAF